MPALPPLPTNDSFLPSLRPEGEPSASPVPALTPGELCRLGPADLADCLALDRLALGGLWTVEQWERELSETQRPVIGVRLGNLLLAMASGWLVLDELHITAVAVHPAHRQCGLGRRVLDALLRQAQEAGAERATLEVSTANGAAKALYASAGFREGAIRRNYYKNGDDALIEFKKLRA